MAATSPTLNHGKSSPKEFEKIFSKFDTNGDGKISPSELGTVVRALSSQTSQEEIGQMMEEMDKDGDGYIDIEEFTDFHTRSNGEEEEEVGRSELKEAFEMYDKDGNGKISASELQSVLKSLGEHNVSLIECSKMIGSFDVDGDGYVDFEEFKKMMA